MILTEAQLLIIQNAIRELRMILRNTDSTGIYAPRRITFCGDHNADGLCWFNKHGQPEIILNALFLVAPQHTLNELNEVIRHELAHVLCKAKYWHMGGDHGEDFMAAAKQMLCANIELNRGQMTFFRWLAHPVERYVYFVQGEPALFSRGDHHKIKTAVNPYIMWHGGEINSTDFVCNTRSKKWKNNICPSLIKQMGLREFTGPSITVEIPVS